MFSIYENNLLLLFDNYSNFLDILSHQLSSSSFFIPREELLKKLNFFPQYHINVLNLFHTTKIHQFFMIKNKYDLSAVKKSSLLQ